MANEVSDYVASLEEPVRGRIAALYAAAVAIVPEAEQGLAYGMPALLFRGKGLFSAMSTKHHIGVYPFGNLAECLDEVTAAGLGSTKGAIHLRGAETLPEGLLERLLRRRVAQISARSGH